MLPLCTHARRCARIEIPCVVVSRPPYWVYGSSERPRALALFPISALQNEARSKTCKIGSEGVASGIVREQRHPVEGDNCGPTTQEEQGGVPKTVRGARCQVKKRLGDTIFGRGLRAIAPEECEGVGKN